MKNTSAAWRWTKVFAPPFIALVAIGCSGANLVGPASISDDAAIGDKQTVVPSDQIVDVRDLITPDKIRDASRTVDVKDIVAPDKISDPRGATDVNDLVGPDKTADPSRSTDVNDLPTPQLSEDLRGRICDRSEVPDPGE